MKNLTKTGIFPAIKLKIYTNMQKNMISGVAIPE
jgi:hypothetical protein